MDGFGRRFPQNGLTRKSPADAGKPAASLHSGWTGRSPLPPRGIFLARLRSAVNPKEDWCEAEMAIYHPAAGAGWISLQAVRPRNRKTDAAHRRCHKLYCALRASNQCVRGSTRLQVLISAEGSCSARRYTGRRCGAHAVRSPTVQIPRIDRDGERASEWRQPTVRSVRGR